MKYDLLEYWFYLVSKRHTRRYGLLLITYVLASVSVEAKEIYVEPSASVRGLYDDNKRLRPDAKGIDNSAYGIINIATIDLGVRSDSYNIGLKNQVLINRYDSEFDLDSDDYNFTLTSNYSFSPRSRIGITASYKKDTTLTSELEDGGTGLVQDNITRKKWSVGSNYSFSLTPTQFLQASYSHMDVEYEKSDLGSFVNNTIDFGSLSYNKQWTSKFSNFLSFSAMLFDIPEIDNGLVNGDVLQEVMPGIFALRPGIVPDDTFKGNSEIIEYSVSIGMEYKFLPTWSSSLSVGQRFTHTKSRRFFRDSYIGSEDDARGLVFSLGLDKQFETGSASINFSRSTSAQGNGRLKEQDTFTLKYTQDFSKKIRFNLIAETISETNSGSNDDGNDRDYYKVRPSIRWSFCEEASVAANYQYRRQERERNDTEAVSNSVSLVFSYEWDKIASQKY